MDRIECVALVDESHRALVQLPDTVAPGEHRLVVLLNESPTATPAREIEDLPDVSVGVWPAGLSLRREDMYDDG